MKKRLILTSIFILTCIASWGWSNNETFTDSKYPGLTFKIVNASGLSVRVSAVDVTKTTGGTDVVIPGDVTATTKAGAATSFKVRYSGHDIYTNCTSVTFGENITTIDNGAFGGCPNLTQVNLPASLTTWSDFSVHQVGTYTTTQLSKFTLAEDNTKFSLNADGNALMSADGTILYCILSNKLVGSTVTPLITINVPDGVEYFANGGTRTFGANSKGLSEGCQSTEQVTTINLPVSFKGVISSEGVTSTVMAATTFSLLNKWLTAINVDKDNTVYANNNNDGILYTQDLKTLIALPGAKYYNTTYTVADEVTTIAANAAYASTEIGIDLNNVESVGNQAFSSNEFLETVSIGSKLTTLSSSTFADCGSLTTITVDSDNPKYASNDGVLYGPGETDAEITAVEGNPTLKWKHLMTCPAAKTGEYTVKEDTQVIDAQAFKGSALTKVGLAKVNTIGSYAFSGSSIKTLDIPNSVTSVGEYAFNNCKSLTTATVGTGLTELSDHMFAATSKLNTLTFATPSNITTIRQQAFTSTKLPSITIPASVTTMETLVFQNAKTTTVTFADNSELNSISGTFRESKVKTVDFGNGSKLKTIGSQSFYNVTTLTEISNFPSSVETIGSKAFALCSGLTDFPFASGENSLKTIGDNAFQGCGVKEFTLPEGLETIGREAFRECESLTSLEIPSTVSSIGLLFTQSCDDLERINVSSSNETYSSSDGILCSKDKKELIVFPGGKDMNTFTLLPPSITTIKQYAFYGCTGLKYIVLPKKLTTIENFAFECCDNLQTITFLGDAKPANVDAAVKADNDKAQTKKDAGDTTWQNYADHRFGNATTSAVDFLKNNVTIHVRKCAIASFKEEGSYWADTKGAIVSFDAASSVSGREDVTNTFEYLAMDDDKGTLGIVKSNSTCATAVIPATATYPTVVSGEYNESLNGTTHDVRIIADYAFEDMPSTVKEVVFQGPISYIGANAFNNGHADGTYTAEPESSIESIFFTDKESAVNCTFATSRFELNTTEGTTAGYMTENYPEFTSEQNIYVPKSKQDTYKGLVAASVADQVKYQIPLTVSGTFGTLSREFDVDLRDGDGDITPVDADGNESDCVIAFTGRLADTQDANGNVVIHMRSINCNSEKTTAEGTDGTYIPANTGVLLRKYGDGISYYRIGEQTVAAPSTTLFQPVVENALSVSATDNYYMASNGYVKLTDAKTMPVHKAYFTVSGSGSAKGIMFVWGDEEENETNGIDAVESADNVEAVVYDLAGRRVSNTAAKHGVYVVNNKKMFIK